MHCAYDCHLVFGWNSGIQLISIGILGEYVGRIFIEGKNRQLYLIESIHIKRAISKGDTEIERKNYEDGVKEK